jgi:hypothetical protein
LKWAELREPAHRDWLEYYSKLLALRAAEIAPRSANVPGTDASYERVGPRGLRLRYRMDDGRTLGLEANLCPDAGPGFHRAGPERVIFASHAQAFEGTVAPPWSVRWTLT